MKSELGSSSIFPLFQRRLHIASEVGDCRHVRKPLIHREENSWESRWVGFYPNSEEKRALWRFFPLCFVRNLFTKFHMDFIQELEKIETELTSLGKLKTETLVWQKKVFNFFGCHCVCNSS